MSIITGIWGHLLVTGFFVLWMIFKVYLPHKSHPFAASELTTYGILGTFSGILLGLAPFLFSNQTDITQHIHGLISGIAVAAICSICGMGLALLSKNEQRKASLIAQTSQSLQQTGATADTLASLLQDLLTQAIIQNKQIWTLQKSMVGDEETSLTSHIQEMRLSFVHRQDKLVESFEGFAATMAKTNSEALIEALNDVVRDFNVKITEQFGENFKHLNSAIGELLQWQENYRTEVAELQRQFHLCLEGVNAADSSLTAIADSTHSVVEAAERLEQLLGAYDAYQSQISGSLQAFAGLSDRAQNAFPIIEGNIKQLTEEFGGAVRTSTSRMEETVDRTSRLLEEQVTKLDQALEAELTNSMKTMANQLASLSNQFVSDYKPLTEKLAQLVQLSSTVGSN